MTEPDKFQNAGVALKSGDFERARDVFSNLLELFPENKEYQCGFFAAGYWQNREYFLKNTIAGRKRGSYLYREWDQFQGIAEEREFTGCLSYRAIMEFILGSAAEEFRHGFREEGGSSIDPELLVDLSKCLLRIEDYQNAIEILQYTRRLHKEDAVVLFLLGEALLSTENPENVEQGMGFYRDAFLKNPSAIDLTLVASKLISLVFEELNEKKDQNMELIIEWLPAYVLSLHYQFPLRPISKRDIEQIIQEISRLTDSLGKVIEKYHEKVRARLSFYYLVLMHHYTYKEKDHRQLKEYDGLLENLSPEIHRRYMDNLRKK